MRYNPEVQPLEMVGFTETTNFTIAATGKAFRNLMDGLYSRKIEAAVREICTNAYDSHTAAKTPLRKFRVQLPELSNPVFMVRDYGVGMPHEQVMRRYSTLFDSTKDQSDEEVGMLGLGSKSPFAYTDGFTLRCYDGNERRTYACYLGNGGVPTISVADVSLCLEPRGVEVSFPVKLEDFSKFRTATVRVLKGFPTVPDGLPQDLVRQLRSVPLHYGAGWAVVPEDYLTRESKVWALQGCVYYPVDINQITDKPEELKVFNDLRNAVLLDFPVGSLEFTPGRETLSYTESTVFNLRYHWGKFTEEVNLLFEESLREATTDWERCLLVEKNYLTGTFGPLFRLSSFGKRYAEICQQLDSFIPRNAPGRAFLESQKHHRFTARAGERISRSKYTMRHARNGYSTDRPYYRDKPVVFVERQAGVTQWSVRLHHYLRTNNIEMALGWEPVSGCEFKKPDLSLFGNPPVLQIGDMPLPPRPPAAPRERVVKPRYNILDDRRPWSGSYYHNSNWLTLAPEDEEELDPATPILFCHNERIVEPIPGLRAGQLPPVMTMVEAARLCHRSLLLGNAGLMLVRLHGGETIKRWAKRRLFVPETDLISERMTDRQVADYVNFQNYEYFKETHYRTALKRATEILQTEQNPRRTLSGSAWPGTLDLASLRSSKVANNPIARLERFEQRRRLPTHRAEYVAKARAVLTLQEQEHVLDRALALGLEVLPAPHHRSNRLPVNLLTLPWENLARMLAEGSDRRLQYSWSLGMLINTLAEQEKKQ